MIYSIGEAAKKMNISAHTLRFYDKEGLLPFVKKSSSGTRCFSETDMEWLTLIECLKGTGMSIKNIKQYIDWYLQGDSTLEQRLNMFIEQNNKINQQQEQLKLYQEKIQHKINYYNQLIQQKKK